MSDAWSTNTTLPELAAWVRTRTSVVILTHSKPDGDAVGSTLAVARAITLAGKAAGIVATPWYAGPPPEWLADLAGPTTVRVIDHYGLPHDEPDGVIVLDTGSWSQLHEVEPWLRERHELAAVIDHHVHGDGDVAPRRYISTASAAVCEPAAELCRLLLGKSRFEDLPREVAEPLYVGLATDTGWFRHSNVTPDVMRLAGSLVGAGVDHARLYAKVEQQYRSSRLRLMARALASLELLDGERVALMTLRQQDYHDCHATPNDSGGFVELPLSVRAVRVSVLMTEAYAPPGASPLSKVSMRSKDGDDAVDVNAVARRLGGGGHVRAAGAKVRVPLAEARRMVIEALS